MKPCILSGGVSPFVRHEASGPSKGILDSSRVNWPRQLILLCACWAQAENVSVQSTPSSILTVSFHPAPYSSHPHQQPWTSSIYGRTTPAALTLQSASAEPHTLQPWPGSRVWMAPIATSRWNTEQWSCSSTVVRWLWSDPLAAPSYKVAHAQHLPCQRLGVGLSRSPVDGPLSRTSVLDTKTPGQKMRWAMKSLSNGGRGSGSHEGKARGWGGALSEGCSWGMLL